MASGIPFRGFGFRSPQDPRVDRSHVSAAALAQEQERFTLVLGVGAHVVSHFASPRVESILTAQGSGFRIRGPCLSAWRLTKVPSVAPAAQTPSDDFACSPVLTAESCKGLIASGVVPREFAISSTLCSPAVVESMSVRDLYRTRFGGSRDSQQAQARVISYHMQVVQWGAQPAVVAPATPLIPLAGPFSERPLV